MSYDRRTVKMCVCHRKKFDNIRDEAKELGLESVDEIMAEGIACTGCGMCRPYVKKMLSTGETRFVPGDIYIKSES